MNNAYSHNSYIYLLAKFYEPFLPRCLMSPTLKWNIKAATIQTMYTC